MSEVREDGCDSEFCAYFLRPDKACGVCTVKSGSTTAQAFNSARQERDAFREKIEALDSELARLRQENLALAEQNRVMREALEAIRKRAHCASFGMGLDILTLAEKALGERP